VEAASEKRMTPSISRTDLGSNVDNWFANIVTLQFLVLGWGVIMSEKAAEWQISNEFPLECRRLGARTCPVLASLRREAEVGQRRRRDGGGTVAVVQRAS